MSRIIRTSSVVIGLFIICGQVLGQGEAYRDVPLLRKQLQGASNDTTRILINCKLAEAYRSSIPDSSLFFLTEAQAELQKIPFAKGEVRALYVWCGLLREKGELPRALEVGLKALHIAEANKLYYEEVWANIRVGTVYLVINNYQKAMVYFKKAEQLSKVTHDAYQAGAVKIFFANTYFDMNQIEDAERYLSMMTERDQSSFDLVFYRLKAAIAVRQSRVADALDYYRRTYKKGQADMEFREIATTCNSMAALFKQLDMKDSAVRYAKEGLLLGEKLGYKNRILTASSLLAELYADSDPRTATQYYKLASRMNDSLFGVKKVLQLQAASIREQEQRLESEAASLALRNSVKQWSLIAGGAVLFAIASFLFRNNRQKQRANKTLENTLAELKATQSQLIQSEKMASLGELTAGIAHEIQNPLNFVNNFSEVSNELVDEMKAELAAGNMVQVTAIADDVKDNLEKINYHGKRADAIVKGMLQHSRKSTGKKESTDVNALCDEYLRLAYHGLRAKDKSFNAKYETDFDPTLPEVNVVPQDIGRAILNLVSNAFYVVDEKQKAEGSSSTHYQPSVSISTKNLGNKVEIRVKDNGSGIPEHIKEKIFQPFFTTKPPGQGTGLGLSMSFEIVTKSHGGELKVETKDGEGATFIITLPQ